MKALERQVSYITKEFEQEKALFQQKTEFYEAQLSDSKKREADSQNQLKKLKKESSGSIKELSEQHESSNKTLQQKLLF